MKYVWASWGKNIEGKLPAAESISGFKTRHIRGYGCAVTFSSSYIRWSSPDTTYVLEKKSFASSVGR